MQPTEIKRAALFNDSELRMSANNVRDVIRYLESNGLVRQVHARKKVHPRYGLSEKGILFQQL